MVRHGFSKQTVNIIMRRAGARCSNPSCRRITTGPSIKHDQAVVIGVASHISAASPGGKRYDPNLTEKQRGSPQNGIWLCQNCSKVIDNDPVRFPIDLLNLWKKSAEEYAGRQTRGSPVDLFPDLTGDLQFTRFFYKSPQGYRYRYLVLLIELLNCGEVPFKDYALELWYPPTNDVFSTNMADKVETGLGEPNLARKLITYPGEENSIKPNRACPLVVIVYTEHAPGGMPTINFKKLSDYSLCTTLHRTNLKPLEVVVLISDIKPGGKFEGLPTIFAGI